MFKYIFMQWKNKKVILGLIIIGFFIGSLFLSIGTSLVLENYNYIMDQNSGDYSKQLELELTVKDNLDIEEVKKAFIELGKYGEIQILSLEGIEINNKNYQIVPTIIKKQQQGAWHIPLIKGNYLDGNSGKVILGKDISEDLKLKHKDNIKINEKKYSVQGICGRKNRETIWDNVIYMDFEDYLSTNQQIFYNNSKINKYIAVLKYGKEELINEFEKVEQKFKKNKIEIIYQEMDKSVDNSSLNNSIIITVMASLLVFFVAVINIINLMFYWMMERKKEIGIMKAIGASNSFVIKWLVIEMCLLAVGGAILALISQFIINYLFSALLSKNNLCLNLSFINLFFSVGISGLCGVISAFLIVKKSVMFNPVETISCE